MLLYDATLGDSALSTEKFRINLTWKCARCGTPCRSILDNFCSRCGRRLVKPCVTELDKLANNAGTHIEGSHVVAFFQKYVNEKLKDLINSKVEKGEV